MHSRTLSDFKTQSNPKNPRKNPQLSLPVLDTAYITFYDYERIKKMLLFLQKKNLLIMRELKKNK